tara:strand:+ start:180 stop:341 length:162 start_codon:yes stop_codon:yes gene_type:complete
MGIGEDHPLGGQAVEVDSLNLPIRIQTRGIAIAHVVDEEKDDVWFGGFVLFLS